MTAEVILWIPHALAHVYTHVCTSAYTYTHREMERQRKKGDGEKWGGWRKAEAAS